MLFKVYTINIMQMMCESRPQKIYSVKHYICLFLFGNFFPLSSTANNIIEAFVWPKTLYKSILQKLL